MSENVAVARQYGPPCWKIVVCPGTVLKDVWFDQPVLVELLDYGTIQGCRFPRFSLVDASKVKIPYSATIRDCHFNSRRQHEDL